MTEEEHPNVVLITVDALRYDVVTPELMPFLSKFREENTGFENAYSCGPTTSNSFPPLFTSSFRINRTPYLQSSPNSPFPSKINEKYQSAGFVSNPNLTRKTGYNKGFDHFYDSIQTKNGKLKYKLRTIRNFFRDKLIINKILRKMYFSLNTAKRPYEPDYELNKKAKKWLGEKREPFFLWIHHMEPHGPYTPPKKYLKKVSDLDIKEKEMIKLWEKIKNEIEGNCKLTPEEVEKAYELYKGCVRYSDEMIKEIITHIEEKYPNTDIIITSDHGEEFRDHGEITHRGYFYDHNIKVPLIIKSKQIDKEKITQPVSCIDIAPTILEMTNSSIPKGYEGKSLIERTEKQYFKDVIIKISNKKKGCIISYPWKLIKNKNQKKLFNVEEDPEEKNNFYNEEEKIAEELRKTLEKELQKTPNKEKVRIKNKIKDIK